MPQFSFAFIHTHILMHIITIPFELPICRAIAPHGSITQFRWLECPAMGLALPFPVDVIIPTLRTGIPRLQSVMCSKVDQPRIVCSKYSINLYRVKDRWPPQQLSRVPDDLANVACKHELEQQLLIITHTHRQSYRSYVVVSAVPAVRAGN